MDGKSFFHIPYVFLMQGIAVVFRMTHNKDLPSLFCHAQKHPCPLGLRHHRQPGAVMNRFRRRGGMPAVGNIEYVVKPPHQRHLPVQNPMGINPEQFFGQQDFIQAEMIV